MQCIAVVLASAIALAACSEVNYCGSRMCGNTNAHTFCQFPEGPSQNCVGYISAPLTLEEKSRVIARLNRRRNEAAAGKMRGFPSAGDMLKLRWVEELAREARRWAEQCRPPRPIEEHDACRDLYALSVGQCVASVVGEAPGLRVESMVDIWYMQSMSYKGNVTFYVPPSRNGSFYGDFAQIMWAQTYMVGCGRSRFMIPWQGRLRSVERLVCNFAPQGPPPWRSLWTPTSPAASCPSRSQRDTVLHALCDYPETVRELQEALDRIENEMASKAGKVRRELRSRQEPETTTEDKTLSNAIYNAEVERNKTLERGPMYNMVLKYMPYLKQYEKEIMPSLNYKGFGALMKT
ncbi:hypothetical protein PYW08_001434 [Mythimna loreyi]|uniref:Uncharacterized protein n=1 Tax=Mythimna loreyi TaxID=667449 RepID=A0ACC2R9B4_9NEOP|nr:hypothetical protein PYW08_001434 [Mythimna loreyi]